MKVFVNEFGFARGIVEANDPLAKWVRVGDEVNLNAPEGGAFDNRNKEAFIQYVKSIEEADVILDPSGYTYILPFDYPVKRQCRKVETSYSADDRGPNIEREKGYKSPSASNSYWEVRHVVNGVPEEWFGRFTEPLGQIIS